MALQECGHSLLRGEHEHETRKERPLLLAPLATHTHGGVRGAIHLKDVLGLHAVQAQQFSKLALLMRKRTHYKPMEVYPIELVVRPRACAFSHG